MDDAHLPGRVPPPENLHVTIRWFGDLDAVTFDRVVAGIDEAPKPSPFVMRIAGVGAFPRPQMATVVWLRPVAEQLVGLRDAVDDAADRAGLAAEDRPFVPHLTVSRLRPPEDVSGVVASSSGIDLRVPVDRVAVLRSLVGGGPPRYELLESIPL